MEGATGTASTIARRLAARLSGSRVVHQCLGPWGGASAGALVGSLLLCLGAFRAGVMGLVRCVLLLAWAWTFLGVLKEADARSIRGWIALCVVFVPSGVQVLRDRVIALRTSTVPAAAQTVRSHWLW